MADCETASDFLKLWRLSRLTDAATLDRFSTQWKPDSAAALAADAAVDQGLLTRWQASRLLAGDSGLVLGRYQLLDMIGSGAFGGVFRARHEKLGRIVAVKVLPRSLAKDPHVLARFHREIQTAASLDHPNIVHVYDAESFGRTHFLVMEYVPGVDLASLLKTQGPLTIDAAARYAQQAALGLQHASDRGLVHRDIKPSNLIVTRDSQAERVKILDFGLAKFVSEVQYDGSLTEDGQVLGTPDYMSPEQAINVRGADIRSDQYSLGCTLYKLLTNQIPFPGEAVMQRLIDRTRKDAPRVESVRPGVPRELGDVLARMLNRNPADRYASPRDVAAALQPFAAGNWIVAGDRIVAGSVVLTEAGDLLPAVVTGLKPDGPGPRESEQGTTITQLRLAEQPQSVETAPKAPAVENEKPGSEPFIPISLSSSSLAMGERNRAARERRSTGSNPLNPVGIVVAVVIVGAILVAVNQDRPKPKDQTRPPSRGVDGVVVDPSVEKQPVEDLRNPSEESDPKEAAFEYRVSQLAKQAPESADAGVERRKLVADVRRIRDPRFRESASRSLSGLTWPIDLAARRDVLETDLMPGLPPPPRARVVFWGDERLKHWNTINAVRISPDGKLVASASADGCVAVWDAETGRGVRWLPGSGHRSVVEFVPGTPWILTDGDATGMQIWNRDDGSLVAVLPGSRPPAFVADSGATIITGRSLRGWSIWTGPDFREPVVLDIEPLSTIGDWTASRNGRCIAVENNSGGVTVIDTVERRARTEIRNARFPVLSRDGGLVACVVGRDTVAVFETAMGERLGLLDDSGRAVAFSADGSRLATQAGERIIVWDVPTGDERHTWSDVEGAVVLSDDLQRAAAGDRAFGFLRTWVAGRLLPRIVRAHPGSLTAIDISPDGHRLATGGADHSLKVWFTDSNIEHLLDESGLGPADVAPDGTAILTATEDGSLKTIPLPGGGKGVVLQRNANGVAQAEFIGEGALVAAIGTWSDFNPSLRIWSLPAGSEPVFNWTDPPRGIRSFASAAGEPAVAVVAADDVWLLEPKGADSSEAGWTQRPLGIGPQVEHVLPGSPDEETGRRLVFTVSTAGIATLYRVAPGVSVQEPLSVWRVDLASTVTAVAWTPDQKGVVLAGRDGAIVVRGLEDGGEQQRLAPLGRRVNSLAVSLNGRWLLAATDAGAIHLWRQPFGSPTPRTPDQTVTLGPSRGVVHRAAFTPDSRHVLTVNGNGTVSLLRILELAE
jgi:serine/threonine protein kinase/WD40 repeat protein